VTPKHVKAAIQDSEFGRNTTNYKQYFVLAIISILLLTASMAYQWWQYQPKPSIKPSKPRLVDKTTKVLPIKNAVVTEADAVKIINPPVTHDDNLAVNNKVAVANDSVSVAASPVASKSNPTLIQQAAAPITKSDSLQISPKPVEVSVKPILETKQTLVEKRLEVTRSWLFSGQPSTMTIQIKSLPIDVKLDDELDRISQQVEIDHIYLYRKKQNGHIYNVILYGQFSQRSDALAALNNLPSNIKNNRPYLRTLAGINRDVE